MIILKVVAVIYALFFIPTFLLARYQEKTHMLPEEVPNRLMALRVFIKMWAISPWVMPMILINMIRK